MDSNSRKFPIELVHRETISTSLKIVGWRLVFPAAANGFKRAFGTSDYLDSQRAYSLKFRITKKCSCRARIEVAWATCGVRRGRDWGGIRMTESGGSWEKNRLFKLSWGCFNSSIHSLQYLHLLLICLIRFIFASTASHLPQQLHLPEQLLTPIDSYIHLKSFSLTC